MRTKLWRLFQAIRVLIVRAGPMVRIRLPPAQSQRRTSSLAFGRLLQTCMLRETNIKDICVDLARVGKIENTWGGGNQKPYDGRMIKLNSTMG